MTQPARRTFLPGHVVVIICSITIQLSNLARTIHLEQHERSTNKFATIIILGVLFLSYPLLGYIADVCLNRYRTLKCSFIFLIVGTSITVLLLLIATLCSLTEALENRALFSADSKSITNTSLSILAIPLITMITTGIGLFEANAIQFGLDQLLEAPTPKLIAFIHWYYWTHNTVQFIATNLIIGSETLKASVNSNLYKHFIKNILLISAAATVCLAAISSLVLLYKSKSHLYTLRAGLNPLKNIYKVLKYSWNHKVPGPSAS